ncbi:hypothetical protein IPM19_03600 [bacterium]|nr:MAG: hypothetical protein IPM19_03600 [bacterium]
MNQPVSFIYRQTIFAFVAGLIAGGLLIGLYDTQAKHPLFSDVATVNATVKVSE